MRKDGSLVRNQHRMGPLHLDARRYALEVVLGIQREINEAADAARRPRIDILNGIEVARILALIAANTWPKKWSGTEPRADAPFAEGYQGTLFDDDCDEEEAA